MRCPKCHYISFDSVERCRNCGYDFSLVAAAPDSNADLETKPEPVEPFRDLPLTDFENTPDGTSHERPPADRTWSADEPGERSDLLLFPIDEEDDRPLVTPPATPRAPLAVRRATPAVPRLRTPAPESSEQPLRFDLDAAGSATPTPDRPQTRESRPGSGRVAGVGRRLAAAAFDASLLLGVDAAVVYLTLRVAGLSPGEARLLPAVPLAAFLLLVDFGYLMAFTATVGQTIGKMAAGIRVVDDESAIGRPPDVGQAALRALVTFASVVPLGLGYWPALTSGDGRTFHDRVARTRVVRAG
jgi:uncharacterized RDD family membrane protein YckC